MADGANGVMLLKKNKLTVVTVPPLRMVVKDGCKRECETNLLRPGLSYERLVVSSGKPVARLSPAPAKG